MLAKLFILLAILLILTVLICLLVMCNKFLLPRCCLCFQKNMKKLENKLMYNSILRSLMQSYLLACISMWYYLLETDFSSSEGIINFCVALAILFLTVSFPIYALFLLRKKRNNLKDKTFKAKYDSLYQNVDYYKSKSLVNASLFLWRRLIFAFVIVFLSFSIVL